MSTNLCGDQVWDFYENYNWIISSWYVFVVLIFYLIDKYRISNQILSFLFFIPRL